MIPPITIYTTGSLKDFTSTDCHINHLSSFPSSSHLREMATQTTTPYFLLYTGQTSVKPGAFALERMCQAADMTAAGMLYCDYYKIENGIAKPHPTIDYQAGSLRDDFDFGTFLLFRTDIVREATARMEQDYHYAALYDLRLKISQISAIVRLPEFLYTITENDLREPGEKQFDYVDPKNRAVQIEMEQACTEHLKTISAWLPPVFREIVFTTTLFPVEASVIIPVRNRCRTITDAIHSVLRQEAEFEFNVIVVDNHSNDGTTEALRELAKQNPRLIHHIPARDDLGIGGCWNEAIMHPACGKFAIQLDSDDLYISERVVQTIVRQFYEQNCAMVIGSYQMVNFNLEEIPPGLIAHREWSHANGHNNALRINGLGAPRAFYTPVIRQIKFPNVSYGEDYAVGLAISRNYRIGRIYEPLYLCRRWDENSDANLDVQRSNTYHFYKDKLRTMELQVRMFINHQRD